MQNLTTDMDPANSAPAAAAVRIWSPSARTIRGPLGESIAEVLSAAFSSREWTRAPMPIGDRSDPHSASGILAQWEDAPQVLLASEETAGVPLEERRVLGCVVGGVLDAERIDAYRLGPFGAREGDGLLAYIGVAPCAQGLRLSAGGSRREQHVVRRTARRGAPGSSSLASALFSGWLAQPVIGSCPAVFVRTRTVLAPIIHMATDNGFEYTGSFTIDFHGERQDRIVFRRESQVAGRDVSRRIAVA